MIGISVCVGAVAGEASSLGMVFLQVCTLNLNFNQQAPLQSFLRQ